MIKPQQDSHSAKPYVAILVILFLAWFFIAKLITDRYVERQADDAFEQVKEKTHESIAEFQSGFDKILGMLHAVPLILSRDTGIGNALKEENATPRGRISEADYRRIYERDPDLSRINHSLFTLASEIRIIDAIWILDRGGRVILSSNAGTKVSFVGNDVSFRRYFKMAKGGKTGLQYGADLITGSQCIYFSAPVYDGKRVIGAIAARIELKDLTNLVHHAGGFLIDEFGIIVEAKKQEFLMMALPDSKVLSLPESQRMVRYQRKEFRTLPVQSWRGDSAGQFVRFGESGHPYYVESFDLLKNKLRLMIAEPLPFPGAVASSGKPVFFSLLIGGWLAILIVIGVVYQARIRQIMALNRERQSALEHIATHDVLTGVYSRVVTESKFDRVVSYASENNTKFALLFIDLDFFKRVNDTHGHSIGDEVLKLAADRLKASVRKSDIIIRYGGDEFLILLGDVRSTGNVAGVAANVLDAIGLVMPVQEVMIKLSCSIGVAMYPDDGETLADLVKYADEALYRIKKTDRSRFAFYGDIKGTDRNPPHVCSEKTAGRQEKAAFP